MGGCLGGLSGTEEPGAGCEKNRADGGLNFPEGTMAILPLKAALQGERKGLPEEGGGSARKGGRAVDTGQPQ